MMPRCPRKLGIGYAPGGNLRRHLAALTQSKDRKRMLRLLIKDITVENQPIKSNSWFTSAGRAAPVVMSVYHRRPA